MNIHRTEHKHASRTPRGAERVPAPSQSQHSSVNQLERSRGRRRKTRWENTPFPMNFTLVRRFCPKSIKTKRDDESEPTVRIKQRSNKTASRQKTLLLRQRAVDDRLKVDHVSFWSVRVSQYTHSSGPLGQTGVKP